MTGQEAGQTEGRQAILVLENVGKRFGGTVALQGLDWTVERGEVHCLIGENGSGKSTLIKIVAGVHAPDAGGKILIGNESFARVTPHQSRSRGVQVIYQDLSLFPNLSVMENIAIDQIVGAGWRRTSRSAMRRTAASVLASLGEALPLDAKLSRLSIAQRQIVAICRGLAVNARLLFMDEPTSSLTRNEVRRLLDVVRQLKALGVAVVFVSHRLEEVVEIADRVTVLRDGRKVGTFPAREIDDRRLTELMTGSAIDHVVVARPLAGRRPRLEVSGATRSGEFEDVSFTLHEGEVLGLTGLLGSGRTELALALFGMTRLARGEIKLDGNPLRMANNQDAIGAGIAYVSEDRLALGANLKQSIAENISVTLLDRLTGPAGLVAPSRRLDATREWIGRLSIRAPDATAAVQTLSGGNQQRVVLAKWLATNPKVLLLDSPTVGVDVRNKQGIYEVIRSLARSGVAILLISDEVPEVYFNADRVLHMRAGRIAGEFVPGHVDEDEIARAVYA